MLVRNEVQTMDILSAFRFNDINEELKEYRNTPNALLLDVRDLDEYNEENIPGSINIPVEEIDKIENMHYDKETPIYVYCHSGQRAGLAVIQLWKMGYINAKNIGGITHYKKED